MISKAIYIILSSTYVLWLKVFKYYTSLLDRVCIDDKCDSASTKDYVGTCADCSISLFTHLGCNPPPASDLSTCCTWARPGVPTLSTKQSGNPISEHCVPGILLEHSRTIKMSPVQKRQHGECRMAKSISEVGCVWSRSWVSLSLITLAPGLSRRSRVMTQNIRKQTKRKCLLFIFSELVSGKVIIFFENWRPGKVAPRTIRTEAKFSLILAPVAIFYQISA